MKRLFLLMLLPFLIWGDPEDSFMPIQGAENPTTIEIDHAFDETATHYNLPAPLLKAISYYQNLWNPYNSSYGRYGLMSLRYGNSIDSIQEGAKLTGYPEFSALNDYRKSIQMSAAILKSLKEQAQLRGEWFETIEDYYPILVQYYDFDPTIKKFGERMAFETFVKISEGYTVSQKNEMAFTIPSSKINFAKMYRLLPPLPYATIDSITSLDDPDIDYIQSPNHYDGREGNKIDQVVVHIMQGTMNGTIGWFQHKSPYTVWENGEKKTYNIGSSHYVISAKGEIVQMVSLSDGAWHAGSRSHNMRSVGIEHGGWYDPDHNHIVDVTDIEYRASAMLTRWLCEKYDIPIVHIDAYISPWNADDTKNNVPGIYGHRDITGKPLCPGWHWDWDKYLGMIQPYSTQTGTVRFLRPLDGSKTTNPVILQAYTTGAVKTVKYLADGVWPLGESSNATDLFKTTYTFDGIDKIREITAIGYDADGLEIKYATHTISFTPSNAGSGSVTLTKPSGTHTTNPVIFESQISGAITKVAYYVELTGGGLYHLDTALSSPYHIERLFGETGNRIVFVYGLTDDDFIVDMDFRRIIVPEAQEAPEGSVNFLQPTAGQNLQNPVTIKVQTGGEITGVEIWDSEFLIKKISKAPFTITHSFTPGSHTVHVYGHDQNGMHIEGAKDTVTFSVLSETTDNNVFLISPSTTQAQSSPVTFQASVAGQVTQVQYTIQGEKFGPYDASPYTYVHEIAQPGIYSVTVEGLDKNGIKIAERTIQFSVITGGDPDEKLEFLSITNGEKVDNPVFIKLEASNKISGIKLYDNGAPLLDLTGTSYGLIRRPFQIAEHTFEGDKHMLTAEGYDAYGKVIKTTVVAFTIRGEESNCSYNSGGTTPIQLLFLLIPALWFIRRRKSIQ